MKNIVSILILFISFNSLLSQNISSGGDFKAGELIVKFKDQIDLSITYDQNGKGILGKDLNSFLPSISKIDSTFVLFTEKSVKKSIVRKEEQEFRFKTSSRAGSNNPTFLDDEPEIMTYKNTLRLKFNGEVNLDNLIEEIKNSPDVEYVEPNYLFSINDYNIDSDVIYEENLKPVITNSLLNTPTDPLYSEQVGIGQTNVDKVWEEYTTGDGSQIVAVLDTGIDYTHPDLEDNIWINEAELNGVEGVDDDGNGYIDDIRGWDFHHNTNTPLDDNMHGTHVAGIIGAVANNDKGIAGVVWNVKLMPIKILQASGIGDVATIALGVDYATNNGATVINMSFGGGISSITLKNALANAYAGSKRMLVAAAGNNGLPLPPCFPSQIFYPAAYTFVFGVETDAAFSNYDCDGPIFSTLLDQQNYETDAPGVSVMSTVPKGGYRALSGTSMAAPYVSGIVALYNETRTEFETNERKFGNLINTKGSTFIDALAAIKAEPKPILKLLTAQAIDSISTNTYQDGQLDAGEDIHLYPTVKNYWGMAENVKVKLKLTGNEFSNEYYKGLIDIQDSIITLGTISDYALYKQRENPLKFKISENTAHNTQIEFRMLAWEGNEADPNNPYASERDVDSIDFRLMVKNGVKLQGLIDKDTILYPKHEYLITSPLVIEGANLIIKPGVTIRFGKDDLTGDYGQIKLFNQSSIIADGTKDSLIILKPDSYSSSFGIDLGNNGRNGGSAGEFDWVLFDRTALTYPNTVRNSQFIEGGTYGGDIKFSNYLYPTYYYSNPTYSNIIERSSSFQGYYISKSNFISNYTQDYDYIGNYKSYKLAGFNAESGVQEFKDAYVGTSSIDILKELNTDAFDGNSGGVFKYSDPRLLPYEEAPAIVWKVEVNGKNAWDDYDDMDPIGVGSHEFKVYFNREVDTTQAPNIGYGVREPWNSRMISEKGSWSSDGKIYSVSHDINIGSSDGINRISVWGVKDLNGWDVPIERRRFNMLIQSAGSASTGFNANPGLGEITLEWTSPSESDLADVLGYNMYRYKAITDSTYSDPVKINESLITEIKYKDYDVERLKQYYYKYKVLTTNLTETDYSKTVTAELLTADLGDSNGDSSVNVLDVVNCVDYILGNNPGPFIDYATDVNNDSSINVLDVVGIVDLVLNDTGSANPTGGGFKTSSSNPIEYYSNVPIGKAEFYWEGNDLYVESKFDIGGMQLTFDKNFKYQLSEEVSKFEHLNFDQDNKKVFMIYSFNSTSAKKKTKLLTRLDPDAGFDIGDAVVGTTNGLKLQASYKELILPDLEAPDQGDELKLLSISPSPSNGKIKVRYYVPQKMDRMVVRLYNTLGQLIWSGEDLNNNAGYSEESINLNPISKGIYIFTMDAFKSGEIKDRTFKRLIIE